MLHKKKLVIINYIKNNALKDINFINHSIDIYLIVCFEAKNTLLVIQEILINVAFIRIINRRHDFYIKKIKK